MAQGMAQGHLISIHALRKESDLVKENYDVMIVISIHALRKESDYVFIQDASGLRHFNPRSP